MLKCYGWRFGFLFLTSCFLEFLQTAKRGVQPLEALADMLTNASRHYNSICIVGDFNLPSLPVLSGSTIDDVFVDAVMTAHNLQQVNFFPTRGDNILDLVLCSGQHQISCETGDNIFASDHNSVRINLGTAAKTMPSHVNCPIFNFRKADLNDLQRTME